LPCAAAAAANSYNVAVTTANGGATTSRSQVRTSSWSWSFVVTVACGTQALQADSLVKTCVKDGCSVMYTVDKLMTNHCGIRARRYNIKLHEREIKVVLQSYNRPVSI